MRTKRSASGYMLLEALIAVTIIGVVLPPLLISAAERLHGLKTMENELIAGLVALNQVTQIRLANRINDDRPQRQDSGTTLMAQREWFWRATSEPTEAPGFFRLEVVVGSDKALAQPLADVVAFFSVEQADGVN